MNCHSQDRTLLIYLLFVCILSILAGCTADTPDLSDVSASTTLATGVQPVQQPVVALLAPKPVRSEVEKLDQVAHQMQTQLLRLIKSDSSLPESETLSLLTAYSIAETVLDEALVDAWNSMPLSGNEQTVWISQPMMLAGLNLHIEVRRRLGPEFHTVVPGLTDDSGCAGDIVIDKLIYQYLQSVANSTIALQGNQETALKALHPFARQIACLGSRQLSLLELALVDGFYRTADQMGEENGSHLIPAFARLVSPLQILILDARKHRGEHSLAWHWFQKYGEDIKQEVSRSGWPTDQLLVWDRFYGVLVGFPNCALNTISTNCVDIETFIDSLLDPRAMGLGDCALAGMLSKPIDSLAGDPRYTCPTVMCTDSESTALAEVVGGHVAFDGAEAVARGTAIGPNERALLGAIWPNLAEEDFQAMGNACKSANDLQNAEMDIDACFSSAGTVNANPFDTHAACMVQALGTTNLPTVGASLQGVPMGSQCGLVTGGEEPPPQTEPSAAPESAPPEMGGDEEPPPQTEPSTAPESAPPEMGWFSTVVQAVITFFRGSTPTGGASAVGGAVIGIELQALDADAGPKAVEGAMNALVDRHLKDALGADRITIDEYVQYRGRGYEAVEFLNSRSQNCLDPLACGNDCTGLGQQINAANACTEDLLKAILETVGRPLAEIEEGALIPPLDIYINPNPDEAGGDGEADGLMACLSDTTHAKPSLTCGLILCPGTLSVASAVGSSACGCNDEPAFLPSPVCAEVRCAEGLPTGADCTCEGTGSYNLLDTRFDTDNPLIYVYEQTLTIKQEVWGAENPSVALLQNDLAAVHFSLGNRVEAEALLNDAITTFEATLDNDHPVMELMRDNISVFENP